jgi:exopolysaccharide production protein ExoQ
VSISLDRAARGAADSTARRDALVALTAILILTDFLDVPLYRFGGRLTELLPGVPLSRLMLLPVFAAAALLLVPRLTEARRLLRAAWPLWPAPLLCVASALWSEQPRTTLLWSVALLGTTAFGLALAVRFAPRVQAQLVLVAAAIATLVSIALVLWLPKIGVSSRREWRGIYVHKNSLGRVLALGITAAATMTVMRRWRAPALTALLVFGTWILLGRSRASLLVAAATLAVVGLLLAARRWRHRATAIIAGGTLATALGGALLLGTPVGLAMLGRDQSFSARTTIWRAVVENTTDDRWFGHGYAAFWPSAAGVNAGKHFNFILVHAHNGFVDIFAELGVVGLLVVCAPLAFYTVAALRHAVASGPPACLWPAAFMVFFVASNLGESPLLRHKLGWALYVAVACHMAAARARTQ